MEERFFTEANYLLTVEPSFSALGSIIIISSNIFGGHIVFYPDDSIGDLLGFKPKVIHKEYTLPDFPVDILSSDKIFVECDVAHGVSFKGRRSCKIHNWTMTLNPR